MDESLNRAGLTPRLHSAALTINLDKALLRSDPLHERLFIAFKARPAAMVPLAFALLKGRRRFRDALLRETGTGFRISSCPREAEVEALIADARHQGKPVDWVSREPLRPGDEDADVRAILDGGEVFDGSLAADGHVESLRQRHPDGFAYVGHRAADLPLWRAAAERYGVKLAPAVRRQAEREGLGIVELVRRRPLLPDILRAMRPHQWLKNLLVFVPFGLSLGHIGRGGMVMALLAFVSLCLMTSGSYLINDMFDLEADRRHPRKRQRPIAAGDVSIPVAGLASLGLIGAALLLGVVLKPLFAAALAAYLCITLAYSFRLKRLAMVDVLVIAVLFTLRILAGMLMVNEAPSHWLLMFSIFFFLSLAFMKREVEFNVMHQAGRQVLSGRGYAMEDRMYVLSCGLSSGMASIVIFGLFISETASLQQANYGAPILLWGVMFCLTYWILRMWLLTTRGLMNDDPILFAAQDRTSILIATASALLAVASQVLVFR